MVNNTCSRLRPVTDSRLENRINCAIFITNTADYDPALYDPTVPSSYIKGSLRYSIQQATDAFNDPMNPHFETVFFDTNVDLGGGVHFGDKISANNTINLQYGSIVISTPLSIRAPRFGNNHNDYVHIRWNGSSPFVPFGSDWSVIQIGVKAQTTGTPTRPDYGAEVELGGLKITGGKGELGGGINANGVFGLTIHQCEISNNRTNRIDEFRKFTAGAGIYTSGQSLGSHGGGMPPARASWPCSAASARAWRGERR